MTGPHRRKQWTRRSLYKMLSAFKDTNGLMTSRPTLHIFIPGQIGASPIPRNTSYIERWGDVFNDLIAKGLMQKEPAPTFLHKEDIVYRVTDEGRKVALEEHKRRYPLFKYGDKTQ